MKHLMIIITLLFCSTLIFSQSKKRASTEFGLKTGVNMSYSDGNWDQAVIGYQLGAFLDINLTQSLFIRTGLEFTTKGAKGNPDYKDAFYYNTYNESGESVPLKFTGNISNTYKLRYLQVPLTLAYRIPVSKDICLTPHLGGYFSGGVNFNISNTTSGYYHYGEDGYGGDTPITITPTSFSGKDWDLTGLERLDWGLIVGVSAEYRRFVLNLFFERGLRVLNYRRNYYNNYYYNDYYSNNTNSVFSTSDWHNYNLSLSIGYKF